MAAIAGAHGERVRLARALRTGKGRQEQGRFAFEGPTLLEEALRSGAQLVEIFATERTYAHPAVQEAEAGGTPVFLVDERTAARLSSVETATGLLTVAPIRYVDIGVAVASRLSIVLAGIADPGNAGTLLRSAEAFGAQAVVFGAGGVDPYHPKVVRAAMGALLRLAVAVSEPQPLLEASRACGALVLGLEATGEDLRDLQAPERTVLVVGHERHGLGGWAATCDRRVAIPMNAGVESLNAAVAGSIALYLLATQAA